MDDFRKWYSVRDNEDKKSTEKSHSISSKMSLEETRRVSRLSCFSFDEIKEVFEVATDSDGTMSRNAFEDCFAAIAGATIDEDQDYTLDDENAFHDLVSNLYNVFDTDGNGVLDLREVLSGLSVLVSKLPEGEEDKIDATFKMYDFNGDHSISLSEMTRYLHAVFKIMYETSDAPHESDLTPLEMARVTALQAFEEADLDNDESLSLEEFKAWFKQSNSSKKIERLGNTAVRRMNLDSLRTLTHLNAYSIQVVFTAFANHSDEHGLITRENFVKCFLELIGPHDERDDDKILVTVGSLYDIFDIDNNGVVDLAELSSGIGILCKGTAEEKAKASFELYDLNGDGVITQDEMIAHLNSVFKIMYHTSQMSEHMPREYEMAKATAQRAFEIFDKDHDGVLTEEEFLKWYTETNEVSKDLMERKLSGGPQGKVEENYINLEEILRVVNFRAYDVGTLFECFAERTDDKGSLDFESFTDAVLELSSERDEISIRDEDEEKLDVAIKLMFELFDRDNSEKIDFVELCSGISILAGGSKNERCEASFALYDLNNDGYITLTEMTQYLRSVFRVMYGTIPDVREEITVNVDELAEATAQDAFQNAKLDLDGNLTLEEFRKWYVSNVCVCVCVLHSRFHNQTTKNDCA